MTMKLTAASAFVAASLLATQARAGGPAGHSHDVTAFGRPGDPKKPARTVEVVMREGSGTMEFVPNAITVKKGEQIRFKLRNAGELDHELVIGTLEENLKHAEEMKKNPDMEHDDPNAKRLAPKRTGDILWRFDKTGEFDFSCLIPGHREAGMSGKIVVR
jgi:uncharacterized cupredoxin-like copper-binding protein